MTATSRYSPLPPRPRRRVVVGGVAPCTAGGRFPIRRVEGERIRVTANIFADSHDRLGAVIRYRQVGAAAWSEAPLSHVVNDRWEGEFTVTAIGRWEYEVLAWVDHFSSWREALVKKTDAGVDVPSHLAAGALLLASWAGKRRTAAAATLRKAAKVIGSSDTEESTRVAAALDVTLAYQAGLADPRQNPTASPKLLVDVDRLRARFSSWYEVFPRSLGEPDAHGTLRDVIDHLPHVASMGFDVLYLPPIHPIGTTHRKGRNNALVAEPNDVGSPWAIGNAAGGHTAVHPDLGTSEDLEALVTIAREDFGIDVALDIAFQCSPDHPWIAQHPEWFRKRPDGSIQYAENPPKKYEDIVPLDFETEDVEGLWHALLDVIRFWIDRGVRVFRVDNPHTKSFRFWEWAIADCKAEHPDLVFLAEAFTRPRVMEELAKRGFNQSYTYFTWREEKWELEAYMRYLTDTEVAQYYRPNFWPNTPDILPRHLQHGGRNLFVQRLLLASLLSPSWGVYGPAFELQDNRARSDHDEYLDNEKYQLRNWNLADPDSLAPLIAVVNRVRNQHPALQSNTGFRIHGTDSDQVMCWSKTDVTGQDAIIVVLSLDTRWRRASWIHLDLSVLGLHDDQPFAVQDLLTGNHFTWYGAHNYVELSADLPAHVLVVDRG